MSEGMVGLLQQLAVLKAAPDADLDAISGLESSILDIVKKPQRDAMDKIAQAGGVVPGMDQQPPGQGGGMPPGMGPGGPPMSPGGSPMGPMGGPPGGGLAAQLAGAGGGGPRNGGALPPVDELRRLIASSGVA